MLICDFPRPLAVFFLSEWLSLYDLGYLDTAICSRQKRQLFLARLSDDFLCSQANSEIDTDCLLWLILRNIKLSSLNLNCCIDSMESMEYIKNLTKLKSLSVVLPVIDVDSTDVFKGISTLKDVTVFVDTLKLTEIIQLMELLQSWASICSFDIRACDVEPSVSCEAPSENELDISEEAPSDEDYMDVSSEPMEVEGDEGSTGNTISDSDSDSDFEQEEGNLLSYQSELDVSEHPMFLLNCHESTVIHSRCDHLVSFACSHLHLSDLLLMLIARVSPNLTLLNIESCSLITDVSIEEVTRSCRNLKSLNMNWCSRVSDKSLDAITLNCRNLEELHIMSIGPYSQTSLGLLAAACPNMTSYSLSGGFVNLSEIAQYNRKLRHLAVTCISVGFEQVLTQCTELESLTFRYLNPFTTAVQHTLFDVVIRCPTLTSVSLKCNIYDWQIEGLLWCAFNLTSLDVSSCFSLTDNAFLTVAQMCGERLKLLSVAGCLLTDQALRGFAHFSHGLQELSIRCCCNITSDGIQMMIRALGVRSLRCVDLTHSTDSGKPCGIDVLQMEFPAMILLY